MVPESQYLHGAPRLDCETALPPEAGPQPAFRGGQIILFDVTIKDRGLNALWTKSRKIVIAIAKVLGLVGTIVSLAYFGLRNDQLARWTAAKEFYTLCKSDPVPAGLDCTSVEGKLLSPPPYLNSSTMFLGRRETLSRDEFDKAVAKLASSGNPLDPYSCPSWILSCIILLGMALIVVHDWLPRRPQSQTTKDDEPSVTSLQWPQEALHADASLTQSRQSDTANLRHRAVENSEGARAGARTTTETSNDLPPAFVADFIRRCFADDIRLVDSGQVLTALEGFRTLQSHVQERVHSVVTTQPRVNSTGAANRLSDSLRHLRGSYLRVRDLLKLWVNWHDQSMSHERRQEILNQLEARLGGSAGVSRKERFFSDHRRSVHVFDSSEAIREPWSNRLLNQTPSKWSDIRASINQYIDAAEDLIQDCASVAVAHE